MPDTTYTPLKKFVAEAGGMRLGVHQRLRDQLVEWAVEEFPTDAPADKGAEVLAARLRRRIREDKRYGSIIAIALISIFANLVAKLIWEWWQKRHANRVLMQGWNNAAKGRNL